MKRFALTAAALLLTSVAMAQGPGGFGGQQGGFPGGGQRGGFPGGPGGQGGFPGGPGGPMGMPNREVSAVSVPLRALTSYLSLSESQTAKIALLREDAMEAMRPQPGQQRQRNANPSNNSAAERKVVSEITALLSESQRSRLNTLIKALKSLQEEGIRPDALTKLQLTDDQLAKLAAGRAVESVLTSEQQKIAQSYQMPQGGPGGFPGGPGGPPPGFGGGD